MGVVRRLTNHAQPFCRLRIDWLTCSAMKTENTRGKGGTWGWILAAGVATIATLPIRAHALTMCYVDREDNVVCKAADAAPKTVADTGYELALSPDGSRLLYTRDEKGMERTLVVYDLKSGKSHDLLKGVVRLGKWSPDGRTIAFLKNVSQNWQVWTMPADTPAKAA